MFAHEHDWDEAIETNGLRYDVPQWVIRTTIAKESSFDPRAIGPEATVISRGLMQLTEPTARGLGYRATLGDDASRTGGLYDPALSIALGTKLLAQLRSRYRAEPWDRIYAAYNAGSIRLRGDGTLANEDHVVGWRRLADYYSPGWRGAPPDPSAAPAGRASRRRR